MKWSLAALEKHMVAIVRRFPVHVEDLQKLSCLPSVEELRPASCPLCEQPARPPGERLGIVGHGIYRRQVAGIPEICRGLVICVRRFLCRGCDRTISVLPDAVYPRRWYSGLTILLSLVAALALDLPAAEIRNRFVSEECCEVHGWRTLRRWRKQLLCPLWGWLSRQLGIGERRCGDRTESRRRLTRILGVHGATERSPPAEIQRVARTLVVDTAHFGTKGWSMHRTPKV